MITPAALLGLKKAFGQLLMVGFWGTSPSDVGVQDITQSIRDYNVGAVILFHHNFEKGPEELKKLTHHFASLGLEEPLWIAADGEGGNGKEIGLTEAELVRRTGIKRMVAENGYEEFPCPAEAGKMPLEAVKKIYEKMAHYYRSLGINFTLAPTVDVWVDDNKGCIGRLGRAYAPTPEGVIPYAAAFIDAFTKAGMVTCIKHFPGLGSDEGDTHETFTDVSKTWVEARDTAPFLALAPQAPTLMLSHTFLKELDPHHITSLSPRVGTYLREKMHYQGVIVSDALEMKGVIRFIEKDLQENHKPATSQDIFNEVIIRALLAGNDILVFGCKVSEEDFYNIPFKEVPQRAWEAVEKEIMKGGARASQLIESIKAAAARVRALKRQPMFRQEGL